MGSTTTIDSRLSSPGLHLVGVLPPGLRLPELDRAVAERAGDERPVRAEAQDGWSRMSCPGRSKVVAKVYRKV